MLYFYASKYHRAPGAQPRRVEPIGFAGFAAALSVCRSMSEVCEPNVTWLVTVRLDDGTHAPAAIGSGAAAMFESALAPDGRHAQGAAA